MIKRSPALAAAIARVEQTFAAYRAAHSTLNRCRLPDSRQRAAAAAAAAELAYRAAAAERDELVARERQDADRRARMEAAIERDARSIRRRGRRS